MSATLVARLTDVQDRLDALARRHRVPGASLALMLGGESLEFCTGVLNVSTGVDVTPDSVFQIGSNTKIFTTTLVMQLVDSGEVDLDSPVKRYLPEFRLSVPGSERITVRHLLTHTSGIQGDYFDGFGRGDEAIERYVDSLSDIDLVHPVGEKWSYCNSGFVVAGRIVEAVTGLPYHAALRQKICEPLGLRRTTVLAEEMTASRCAVGHVPGPTGEPTVPPVVVMEYAQAPAGSRTVATASELARFTKVHMDGGLAPSGARMLSADGTRAMQEIQFTQPAMGEAPRYQGLGWMLQDWDGVRVIGHGGGTIGQLSFLEAVPDREAVVVLLTNSMTGGALWLDLGRWIFEDILGMRMPTVPKPSEPAPDVALDRYAGVYERLGLRLHVTAEGGELVVQSEPTGAMARMQMGPPPPPVRLRPLDGERFYAKVGGADAIVVFSDFERGRPGYLFMGRLARRGPGRPRPPAKAAPAKASSPAKRGRAPSGSAAKARPAKRAAATTR
ncbi:MAG TPA: serine hydrolase domain-containing protein [Acidimicrobiales bacterium]|nr:serine hydrolase domain-containing protein [Acidimicrobiales bacterium]